MFLNYVLKVTIYDPNNSKLLLNSLIRDTLQVIYEVKICDCAFYTLLDRS